METAHAWTDCPRVSAESQVWARAVHIDSHDHSDPASPYRRCPSHPPSRPIVSKGYGAQSLSSGNHTILRKEKLTSAALLVLSKRSRSTLQTEVLLVSASAPVMIPPKGTSGSFGSVVSLRSSTRVGLLRRRLRGIVGRADF